MINENKSGIISPDTLPKTKAINQSDSFASSTDINSADIVTSQLLDWVKAWQSKNSNLYLSFYSIDFKDPKRSRSRWEAYRRRSLRNASNISIQISNIQTQTANNTARTTFVQRFKSNKISDVGSKELIWEKKGDNWKIIKEPWRPR